MSRGGIWLPVFVAALGLPACTGERDVRLLEPRSQEFSGEDAGTLPDGGNRGPGALFGAACGRWTAVADPGQALLMLVVDVSASMATPSTSQNSRWSIERSTLGSTTGSLPAAVGVGALYYPNMATSPSAVARPVSACVNLDAMVPVGLLGPLGSRQRGNLARSLATAQPNSQAGTPTLDAYVAGLGELGRTTLGGSRQILLITDGQATFSEGCVGTGQADPPMDVSPVIEAVAAAHRAGIKTFVIGAPGSERSVYGGSDARPWLSRAAVAGGTATPGCSDSGPRYCHFDTTRDPDFATSLQGALSDISNRLTDCDFPLPDPPDNERLDLQSMNVVLTSSSGGKVLVANDTSTTCIDGWHYSDDQTRVVLCSAACDLVRSQIGVKIEFLGGCPTITRLDRRDPHTGTRR
ncbi:MAG TPA: vWA domain-containing protein [Polyangiaceae bacterium]